jgi:hypothetical protein
VRLGFRGPRRVPGTRGFRGRGDISTRMGFRVRGGFTVRVSGVGPRKLHPTPTRPVAIHTAQPGSSYRPARAGGYARDSAGG